MNIKFMSNNYKNEGFGIHIFEDDMSKVLVESIIVFAQSLGVFRQLQDLLPQLVEKSI